MLYLGSGCIFAGRTFDTCDLSNYMFNMLSMDKCCRGLCLKCLSLIWDELKLVECLEITLRHANYVLLIVTTILQINLFCLAGSTENYI